MDSFFGAGVDILFFDLDARDPRLARNYPQRFKIAAAAPQPDEPCCTIGFQSAAHNNQKDVAKLYAATKTRLPSVPLFYPEVRTVTIGKVKAVGKGFVTEISVLDKMASGAPVVRLEDGEPRVYGICVGSYYDAASGLRYMNIPAVIFMEENLVEMGVMLPQSTQELASRNRNLVLRLNHSCVRNMLEKL